MSFFFDVWLSQGFILSSDVRLVVNGERKFAHKVALAEPHSKVNCAIAVCGEYPANCLNYFFDATCTKGSLREVAQRFASRWVERYGGTSEYSAVHLVGFEETQCLNIVIPQVWFWCNWDGNNYLTKEVLQQQLRTFTEPVPHNNHIPQIITRERGCFPGRTPKDEYSLVKSFLKRYGPYFTWNGDTSFWRSATDAVGSAMKLLRSRKQQWTLEDASDVTAACLTFLVRLASLLPDSTIGLSNEGDFDLLWVTPEGPQWKRQAALRD